MQERSQKSSNVPKDRRDKKHLVLVCRLTLAFSRPLLGKGESATRPTRCMREVGAELLCIELFEGLALGLVRALR